MFEHPGRQAGLGEDLAPERAAGDRRPLRRLQHDRVAEHEGRRDRAEREDQRRVPRRDRADDADRLPQPHRHRSRNVGRDHLSDRRVGRAGRLAQEAGGEVHLEHAEAERGAGLAGEQVDDLVAPALEDVCRAEEDPLAHAGRRRGPRGERLRGGLDRASRVVSRAGGGAHDGLAGERVGHVEGGAVARGDPLPPTKLSDSRRVVAVSVDCVMVSLLSKGSGSGHEQGGVDRLPSGVAGCLGDVTPRTRRAAAVPASHATVGRQSRSALQGCLSSSRPAIGVRCIVTVPRSLRADLPVCQDRVPSNGT